MIIMKTGFFTKLSLLTLLSLFAINSKAELKQTEKEAFVTIVLNDGQEVIFHIEKRSPMELKGKLAVAISKAAGENNAA